MDLLRTNNAIVRFSFRMMLGAYRDGFGYRSAPARRVRINRLGPNNFKEVHVCT